ncbi:MAG: DsbA family protein [Bryobacteraceae bacterium]
MATRGRSSAILEAIHGRDLPLQQDEAKDRLRKLVLAGAKTVSGSVDAGVVVVVYSDFLCPYCAQLWRLLREELRTPSQGKVALFYRSFPVRGHSSVVRDMDVLANCTYAQNREAFVRLVDLLFSERKNTAASSVTAVMSSFLQRLPGFDMTALSACVASGSGERDLEADVESAHEADVNAVPTVFVNGLRINGLPSPEHLRTLLGQAAAAASRGSAKPDP